MSQAERQGEVRYQLLYLSTRRTVNVQVNRLLGEKEQLRREEQSLRKVIEAVKKQVAALQVEQLEIRNRVPLSRVSPSFFLQPDAGSSKQEDEAEGGQAELNLGLLQQMHRGTFAVEQEEESD
jgi:hypothetical protein